MIFDTVVLVLLIVMPNVVPGCGCLTPAQADQGAGYSAVRSKLSVAICVPVMVESVTVTVKVAAPLWVGVPDNIPALDNAIPFGRAPLRH
jgi:hypothetical protein